MRKILATALVLPCFLVSTAWPADSTTHTSRLVRPAADGRLAYTPYTEQGDRIPDFSNCGYRGGGVPLPKAEVKAVVEPVEGDDGANIQSAIDQVSMLQPGPDGLRGAVLLKKGRYEISGKLAIAAGGVVLRGEGQGEDGTVLLAAGTGKRTLVVVGGIGKPTEVPGSRRKIADAYVPVGARSFRVEDASAFRVGQQVLVVRPSTAEWIRALGMDRIPQNPQKSVVQWAPGSKDLGFDRVVTAVQGDTVTIDAPIVNAMQKEYGGGFVYRYEFPGRIRDVGVENLRGDSEFDATKKKGSAFIDEAHGWNFITINAAENAWVRDVTSIHFGYSCVTIQGQAKWVSVVDSTCLEPVSQITGGRRYSFGISGQLSLVRGCLSRHGRHDFVMHATVPGPNVFLDSTAQDSYCTSEPHHRWTAGVLYDNVSIDGDACLQAVNRGNSGSGHGWSGAQIVFWNCRAPVIIATKPPTAQNFIIGFTGQFRNSGVARSAVNWANGQAGGKIALDGPCAGDAHIESPDAPVAPRSLYLQQLEDRVGRGR